jgi:hypothetical protein
MLTCSSCQFEFTADEALPQTVEQPQTPVDEPIPGLVDTAPIVFQPPDFEPIHEVEHIEVLDEPSPAPPPAPIPSLELGPSAELQPLDEVEVVESPAVRRAEAPAPAVVDAEIIVEPVVDPVAPPPAQPLDQVEVIPESEPPPPASASPAPATVVPVVETVEVVEEERRQEGPPPIRRRARDRTLDIALPTPRGAGTPIGIWIGLGAGAFGIIVLVLVLVLTLGSSGGGEAAVKQDQDPAAPGESYLPSKSEWPLPPDRRGAPPWQPTAPTLAQEVPRADKLPGLLAYWPLDEGAGDQAADRSDRGHKSTLVGGWWINGVRGKALLFDGRRDYLDLGNDAALSFPADGPFTIALWMATRQRDGYLLACRNPRDPAPVIHVKLHGGTLCCVVRADGSGVGEARVGLHSAADGKWRHVALMRHAGGTIETFVDGQSLGKRSGGNTQGPITTSLRTVGCERLWWVNQRSALAYCACAIDELCVFNRALTVQEIASLSCK